MGNIRARFIFEIMGKPADHIKKVLEEMIETLGKNNGVMIVENKIHEPKELESDKVDAKGLFTTFAEVEVELDNLNLLFAVVLNMLPAHVEIIEPEEYIINNFDLSSVLSDLSIKLHKYDEVAKALAFERNNLKRELKELKEKAK